MFCSTPCYLTSPIVLKSSLNCDSGYIFSRYHSKLWQLSFSRSFFLCITSPYSVFLTPGWKMIEEKKRKGRQEEKLYETFKIICMKIWLLLWNKYAFRYAYNKIKLNWQYWRSYLTRIVDLQKSLLNRISKWSV